MNIPIITLELSGIKQKVQAALLNQTNELNASIDLAVEKFCKEENIQSIVQHQVDVELKDIIENEITLFFKYGQGNDVVRKNVKAQLKKIFVKENSEKVIKEGL